MDVISLGFPEQTLPKWLNDYVYEWVQDGLLRCRMRKKFDEVEFYNWKEVAFFKLDKSQSITDS